ncbi:conserved hypothetical protein [Pediculus humanus corporis]|uniref:RNA-binding protein 48 n=1 Tax=Pediculus humanus subsp. corporis TaxID=121224 RepID=E0VHD7_PEDHC|nr:uncharacterized protein Phum_PHUM206410 [Pediculus humanus corporis]EEB12793.1 conserved hypothetical protein [Pediculus humanus corporis]
MEDVNLGNVVIQPMEHHKRLGHCFTRPAYRRGNKPTAVKAYTINDESQHLLVFGVPSLKLDKELSKRFSKYGPVKSVKRVQYPDVEPFTEVFHIQYLSLSNARFAKKKLDDMSFYGGILHICYAPELESIEETRNKLNHRRKQVLLKLYKMQREQNIE